MKRFLGPWGVFLVIVLCTVLATMMGACSKPILEPCQVNPTRQAQDGSWVEADGEPLDDDPCDADDLFEDGHQPKMPTPVIKKPEPKKTPAKPIQPNQPIGGTKKRF